MSTPEFRNAFFSFHYEDADLASIVRESQRFRSDRVGFRDWASWESVRRTSWSAIKTWIDGQLIGTSVTVVLIGAETAFRRAVRYEIIQSAIRGNGIIGIHLNRLDGLKPRNRGWRSPGLSPFVMIPPRDVLLEASRKAKRNKLAELLALAPKPQNAMLGLLGTGQADYSSSGLFSNSGIINSVREETVRDTDDVPFLSTNEITARIMLGKSVTLEEEVQTFCWQEACGYDNIVDWIEKAAIKVGR